MDTWDWTVLFAYTSAAIVVKHAYTQVQKFSWLNIFVNRQWFKKLWKLRARNFGALQYMQWFHAYATAMSWTLIQCNPDCLNLDYPNTSVIWTLKLTPAVTFYLMFYDDINIWSPDYSVVSVWSQLVRIIEVGLYEAKHYLGIQYSIHMVPGVILPTCYRNQYK